MFGLFKKEVKIFSPVKGQIVDLSSVEDEVFSKKMMGDGLAIEPEDGLFHAVADGELTMVFKTGHAFGMKLKNNVEILVHIGIDTVELEGEGFEILKEQGSSVKAGEAIVKVDLEKLRQKGYKLITPVIITGPESYKNLEKAKGQVDINSEIMTLTL